MSVKTEIYNKCRICLEEGSVPIYNGDFTSFNISEKIKMFGNIVIQENDIYPKHLCEQCFSALQTAVDFRKTALETDKILKKCGTGDYSPVQVEALFMAESSESDDEINYINLGKQQPFFEIENTKNFATVYSKVKEDAAVSTSRETGFTKGSDHLIKVDCKPTDNTDKQLLCNICNRNVVKEYWIEHCTIHKESENLKKKCKVCNYETVNYTALYAHVQSKHVMEKNTKLDNHYIMNVESDPVTIHKNENGTRYNDKLVPSVYAKYFKPTSEVDRVECVICGNNILSKGRKDHYASHDPASANRFKCEVCNKGFRYRHTYRHHVIDCELQNLDTSPKCNTSSKNASKVGSYDNMHTCDLCCRHFKYRQTLLKHKRTQHGVEIKNQSKSKNIKYYKIVIINNKHMVQCQICHKTLKKESFTGHYRIMHSKQKNEALYLCEVCGKSCKVPSNYYSHKLTHSNEFNYKCQLCPYRGRNSGLLNSHMRLHNRKVYQCDICSKKCNLKSNLIRHIRSHGEPGHTCNICTKKFYDAYYLKRHLESIHLGQNRSHPCGECQKVYGTRKFLLAHQSKVHGRTKSSVGVHHRSHYKPVQLEHS